MSLLSRILRNTFSSEDSEHKKELPKGYPLKKGTYKIIEKLKSGGFGIVYRAKWENGLYPIVAIKEFYISNFCERKNSNVYVTAANRLKFDVIKEQAKIEAELLRSLSDSNIVRIFDYFEANNTVYIVMEYIEGGSVTDKVKKEGILPIDVAFKCVHEIGKALTYMHKKTMIHLDIKPPNIMIDRDGNPKLIDFGITKNYNNFDPHSQLKTSTFVAYTDGFAPNEQYGGSRKKFSPASDVYALAATFYYCITKTIPPDANDISAGIETIIKASLINPSKNKEIDKVIEKAMAVKPAERYQTVNEFLDDLQAACGLSKEELEDIVIESAMPEGETTEISEPVKEKRYEKATAILPDGNHNEKNIKKENKKNFTKRKEYWIIAAISFLLIVVGGIFLYLNPNEERTWKKAERRDSIPYYQKYLDKYPDGIHAEKAKTKIEEIEHKHTWEEAKRRDSIPYYQKYLDKYPDGIHAEEAKTRIKEELAWEEAKRQDKIPSYRDYLKKYPEGKYVKAAETRIVEIEEIEQAKREEKRLREEQEKQRLEKEKKDLLIRANQQFEAKNFSEAFRLYKELKDLDRNYKNDGYNNFLNLARKKNICDGSLIEWLNNARYLADGWYEINEVDKVKRSKCP
ncbi:MAG: protein kinase [Bacteroidales bacterium]|jgi:serine/threonine-protein kinase|nr:protein kinase [Bacteroidales bacterium]